MIRVLPLFLVACAGTPEGEVADAALTLAFAPTVGGEAVDCDGRYDRAGGTVTGTSLRLFVHDLRLVDAAGDETALTLDDDGRWQDGTVALLDFEDERCDNGSPTTRDTVTGTAPEGDYAALRFTIGVPFERNHVDPATAAAPLSVTTMHWSWQGGFKFLRLDTELDGEGAIFHLGSTGCEGTLGDISGCARPDRPEALFPLADDTVAFALDDLFDALAPGQCMGDTSAGCAPFFEALGLDLTTGEPVGVFGEE